MFVAAVGYKYHFLHRAIAITISPLLPAPLSPLSMGASSSFQHT